MKVIVATFDNDITQPKVFATVAALISYWMDQGWDTHDDDYKLMIEKLQKGESFSDATASFGWQEVLRWPEIPEPETLGTEAYNRLVEVLSDNSWAIVAHRHQSEVELDESDLHYISGYLSSSIRRFLEKNKKGE